MGIGASTLCLHLIPQIPDEAPNKVKRDVLAGVSYCMRAHVLIQPLTKATPVLLPRAILLYFCQEPCTRFCCGRTAMRSVWG